MEIIILIILIIAAILFSGARNRKKYRTENTMSDLNTNTGAVRYSIEHGILKDQFFGNPKFIMALLQATNGAYTFYKGGFENVGAKFPYKESDFMVRTHDEEGKHYLSISLPTPELVPLCYRIILIANEDFSKVSYYTVERSMSDAMLCAWQKGDHISINTIKDPDKRNNDMARAIETVALMALFDKNTGTVNM